ncbi:MAG: response regulator, partial [Bacteroidales bacterium]|nr:response regulator [Bacteroidales bacterium]
IFSKSATNYIIYGIKRILRTSIRYIFHNSDTQKVYEVQNEHAALARANELIRKYQVDIMAIGPSALTGVVKSAVSCKGLSFNSVHDKQWAYKHPNETYFYEIDLIDYDILVSRPSGYIEYNNSLTANVLFDKVVDKMLGKETPYYRIQDYTNVVNTSMRARRDFTNYIVKNIDRINILVFYGLNTYMKAVVKFGKLFHPKFSKVKVANSFDEAFSLVLEHKYGKNIFEGDEEDVDLNTSDSSNKKEVIALKEELNQLVSDQQEKLDLLFYRIGNIAWGRNNAGFSKEIDQESEFSDVFGALQMLQTDIDEMAEEKETTIHDLQIKVEENLHDIKHVKQEFQNVLVNKANFIQNLNHDLRTPLQSINAAIELLKDSNDTNEKERLLKIVYQSSSILSKKVTKFKDISDLSLDKKKLSSSVFSFKKNIQSQIELSYSIVKAKDLKIKFENDDKIPPYLTGDLDKINQVINHFLDNAIKYTNEGQIIIRTILKENLNTQMVVRVEVEDSGIGINPEIQGNLFDEISNTLENKGHLNRGKGLGLFICKQLVELMGGDIGFRSEEGKGSCFYFVITLNLAPFSKELNLLNRPKSFKRSTNPSFKNTKCLIAEGDLSNRKVAQLMFNKLELDIRFVNTDEKLMHYYLKDEYDMIFFDIQMLEVNGFDIVSKIREIESQSKSDFSIPLIALTVNPNESHAQECLDQGFSQVIIKPYSILQLKKAISKYAV